MDTTEQPTEMVEEQPTAETEKESAETPAPREEGGKGSKESVLADLAKERDSRQEAERQVAELRAFREGITRLLGGDSEEADPIELAKAETARADNAERLLAVYQAAPAGTDISTLLDSVKFREGLAGAEEVEAYVKTFIKDNPRYAPGDASVARNLNSGNTTPTPKMSFDDILRSATN